MNAPSERMAPSRHPWLTQFENAPEEAFGDLLAGYADVHPYERADAPDAARMLFGSLDPADSAREALGPAILAWLRKRRKEPLPAARPKLQRRVREICEAFEIVALLNVADAAAVLRQHHLLWNDWVARLVLSPSRDARAEFWRMLALTQGLVAKVATDIDANGLAPMWQDICREAGGRLPPYYLSIGLLGLRRLPNVEESSQLPWVSGLAQWALAQHPSDSEFKTEWLALKPLYPRAPQNCIATGNPQYFVRAVHALGRELIERGGDMPQERTGKAQALAREGLKWQPYDRYLWALWRDALVADNAAEAAELIGWESIRRDPADVDKRNQLATLLVNSLSKLDEAETLLRETIERFPGDVYARTQLAELLIFEDRASEAASVVDATIRALPKNAVPYVIRARLESHAGRLDNAKSAVKDGLELDPHEPVLNQFAQRLKQGEKLPLKSQAFRTVGKGAQTKDVIAAVSDADLAEVLRIGTMRQLRFRLEFARGDEHQRAVKELQKILREDPTFAYAELLAARHRVWEAKAVVLPSFAAAFEDALATEDRENLERLARRQPRLEALILVAQALLGDAEAQRKTELWLREPQIADKEPAIAGLHSDLRRVLRVIEGGRSLKDAFTEAHKIVLSALHDANEAALGETLLAA